MKKNMQFKRLNQQFWRRQGLKFAAAAAFYTRLPVPTAWTLEFQGVARLAPLMGCCIGGMLAAVDAGLQVLGMPPLTRSTVVAMSWIALTGGLHLDGVMDTADGLAVMDPTRRLQVMADSATGAFGAMAAIALLLLKTAALTDLTAYRWLALMVASGWGRWGQLVAIVRYPYLKPSGKGFFHKTTIRSHWELLPGLLLMFGLSSLPLVLAPERWLLSLMMGLGGVAIALLTAAWFNQQLGGHTGDSYGATVEWTEALLLCLLTLVC